MKKIFSLFLLFAFIAVVQPVFAQQKDNVPVNKPAVQEKTAKEGEGVININLASDDEFKKALDKAGDIELVNETTTKPEQSGKKTTESAKKPKQGGSK